MSLREALKGAARTAARLSDVSSRTYQNPYTAVEWPTKLDPAGHWFSSAEQCTLFGTAIWDSLSDSQQRLVSFWEAANFYSINIHGEKALMAGLSNRLYRKDLLDVTDYLHHFLDEENKHSIYFGGFCTRYARLYRSLNIESASIEDRDVNDFLFFAKTMIFEEIVDEINVRQGRDTRLHPLARFINSNHHIEETRHLVFGRQVTAAMWQYGLERWSAETVESIRATLTAFFTSSWREHYNSEVYADAGIDNPWDVLDEAWRADAQIRRRIEMSKRLIKYLLAQQILVKEPDYV